MKLLIVACMSVLTGLAQSSNLTVPNTFSPNTPARAAEVNANFNAVKTAVNDNNARLDAIEALLVSMQNTITAQEAEINQLKLDLAVVENNSVLTLDGYLSLTTFNGFDTAEFTGINLQVNDGSDDTEGDVNGLGNVIVGYNEQLTGTTFCSDPQYIEANECFFNLGVWQSNITTGSHNLILGSNNSYTSYGGVVAGAGNVINNKFSSVLGGAESVANGIYSIISGGSDHITLGDYNNISGGRRHITTGKYSNVNGGIENKASEDYSSVSGGAGNEANANSSYVSGGAANQANAVWSSVSGGKGNIVNGIGGSISGGQNNEANGVYSSVSGGRDNTASGLESSVVGGIANESSGDGSSVTGGGLNVASGERSAVSGGWTRTAPNLDDWVAGSLTEDF